ncbi:DUF3078 domain-containing protein [Niabella insulamsoli]|uniref:DUF3078 domain-containing protein n=1 Tax=Niabella insulamsoli TaxID=3144874 RepID=UPI0031FBEF41
MKKMMMLGLTFVCLQLAAQDKTVQNLKKESQRTITKDPNDTTNKVWKTGGFVGLNVAQGSLSNWAAGGDKFSLAVNGNLSLYAFYKKDKHSWDNSLDINLGYINTTSLGSRKNDDRVDLVSKYGYAIGSKWNVGALFNFRSQLFKGYTYEDDGNRTLSSNFLSPAYVLLSPGFEWKPNKEFSAFLSPATVRWTIVNNDSLSAAGAYGVDMGKHVKTEFGAFASLNYLKEINKMFSYKSKLDLYANYLEKPKNIDLYWTNLINMKLAKFLTVTYSLDMIYDDDARLFGPNNTSPATQIKSMLGLGFLVKF